jgi:hypothetical protein
MRLGNLLWRQMPGERFQHVRARLLIGNLFGGGEHLGRLLRRQMRGERSKSLRTPPLISKRTSHFKRSRYQLARLNRVKRRSSQGCRSKPA